MFVNLNIFLSSVRIKCLGYGYIMTSVKIYLCLTVWHSYPLRTESSVLCLLESEIMRDTTAYKTESFSLSLIASISGFPMFTTLILLLFNRLYLLCVFLLLYLLNSQGFCDFKKLFNDYIFQTGNLISSSDKFFISLYLELDT